MMVLPRQAGQNEDEDEGEGGRVEYFDGARRPLSGAIDCGQERINSQSGILPFYPDQRTSGLPSVLVRSRRSMQPTSNRGSIIPSERNIKVSEFRWGCLFHSFTSCYLIQFVMVSLFHLLWPTGARGGSGRTTQRHAVAPSPRSGPCRPQHPRAMRYNAGVLQNH